MNQLDQEGRTPSNLPRGVSPEIAASNPDVQTIIQPRLQMLMDIANSFLDTIISSLDMVPYGIRWICKQIRSLTRVSMREGPSVVPVFVSLTFPTCL
jgi:Ras GTPase-activating-like protein IQGAP2/3